MGAVPKDGFKARASRAIKSVDGLPVLPLVVMRLIALDAKSDDYFDEVIKLVGMEPNYAARLLHVANSAQMRGACTVKTLRDAVVRLGCKAVASLVVSMSVVRVFIPRSQAEKNLWIHAIQVAAGARLLTQLSKRKGLDPERAYLAGLLHDIGRFLVFQVAPDELRGVDEADWDNIAMLVDVERKIVGVDHARLGAMACVRWGLPAAIGDIVKEHHNPNIGDVIDGDDGSVGELVRAADLIMSGSLKVALPTFGEHEPEDALGALEGALPPWYPKPTKRLIERLAAVEEQALRDATALGL